MNRKQIAFDIIISIGVLIAIGFSLLRIVPCTVTNDTYIGTLVTILGIIVAIVIGYQIINIFQIHGELNEHKKLYEEVKKEDADIVLMLNSFYAEQKEKYKKQNNRMDEKFYVISSLVTYNSGDTSIACLDSFIQMHHALLLTIASEEDRLDFIFSYLRKFISEMSLVAFIGHNSYMSDGDNSYINDDNGKVYIKDIIEEKLVNVRKIDSFIKKHSRYKIIKFEYEKIMAIFWEQIEKIKANPEYQITEKEENYILTH